MEKISKTKILFFKNKNKTGYPRQGYLDRVTKKKRWHKLSVSEIKQQSLPLIPWKLIRENYAPLYVHKFDNLDVMDQFSEKD